VDPSLQDLEQQRKDLFRQMETLGDFRRGTISVNYRKCGKATASVLARITPGTDRSICGTSASVARPKRGTFL
jgi:hypothetical protein